MQYLDYLPWGESFVNEDRGFQARYTFTGKELDKETGYQYFGARYNEPARLGWLSVDPLSDKYPSFSPYVYCANNPVMHTDPDGRAVFENNRGVVIGNDGNPDSRLFVIKTSAKHFGSGENEVDGSGLSRKDRRATIKFIKRNSGDKDAFSSNGSVYTNCVEIEFTQEQRQDIVRLSHQDTGKGGTSPANNREYGFWLENNNFSQSEGPIVSPAERKPPRVEGPSNQTFIHTHPSGSLTKGIDKYFFTQTPSPGDIEAAGSNTCYEIGRGNNMVYIFNGTGVLAKLPLRRFVIPKTKK